MDVSVPGRSKRRSHHLSAKHHHREYGLNRHASPTVARMGGARSTGTAWLVRSSDVLQAASSSPIRRTWDAVRSQPSLVASKKVSLMQVLWIMASGELCGSDQAAAVDLRARHLKLGAGAKGAAASAILDATPRHAPHRSRRALRNMAACCARSVHCRRRPLRRSASSQEAASGSSQATMNLSKDERRTRMVPFGNFTHRGPLPMDRHR